MRRRARTRPAGCTARPARASRGLRPCHAAAPLVEPAATAAFDAAQLPPRSQLRAMRKSDLADIASKLRVQPATLKKGDILAAIEGARAALDAATADGGAQADAAPESPSGFFASAAGSVDDAAVEGDLDILSGEAHTRPAPADTRSRSDPLQADAPGTAVRVARGRVAHAPATTAPGGASAAGASTAPSAAADASWLAAACSELTERNAALERRMRGHTAGNPTGLAVTWLGTSSGAPTIARNTSGIALRVGAGDAERLLLVDAGEGCTYQFHAMSLDVARLSHVFLTHHHGDHCFGLAPLLEARAAALAAAGEAVTPLHVYGPPGTCDMVADGVLPDPLADPAAPPATVHVSEWTLSQRGSSKTVVKHGRRLVLARVPPDQAGAGSVDPPQMGAVKRIGESRWPLPGRCGKHPVYEGLSWSVPGGGGVTVRAAQLLHRVPTWGYVFEEAPAASGARARKVALLGDTMCSSAIAPLATDCDVLSHESTFLHAMARKARAAAHSTGRQAGAFAARVRAKHLVLTHFSGRYAHGQTQPALPGVQDAPPARRGGRGAAPPASDSDALRELRAEACDAYGSRHVSCAFDGFTHRVPRPEGGGVAPEVQPWVHAKSMPGYRMDTIRRPRRHDERGGPHSDGWVADEGDAAGAGWLPGSAAKSAGRERRDGGGGGGGRDGLLQVASQQRARGAARGVARHVAASVDEDSDASWGGGSRLGGAGRASDGWEQSEAGPRRAQSELVASR